MKKIRRKVNKPLLYFVFFIFASISVGYAALSTTLSITGKSTLSKNSWDIHFENLVIVDNGASKITTAPTIDSTKTKVSFNITLSKPGDSYEFTVDAVNKGTIDAMLSGFSATSLTTDQQKYLTYTVTYSDGATISTKDYLKKGASETIRVRVRFRDDLTATDLPSSAETLNLTATLTYVQADSTAKTRTKPSLLCKRGTNVTTSGKLTLADEFYCDVNGDGIYHTTNEVFYYITDLDSNTAVLLYGSYTSGLVKYGTNVNNGPTIARSYLPTTSDWSNVSLNNPVRNISNIVNFSYSGYAARLPSKSEIELCVNNNNNIVLSPGASGTFYPAFWLEDIYDQNNAYYLYNQTYENHFIHYQNISTGTAAVKPVIEVPKSRISY